MVQERRSSLEQQNHRQAVADAIDASLQKFYPDVFSPQVGGNNSTANVPIISQLRHAD